jgi:cell division protein FtsQ
LRGYEADAPSRIRVPLPDIVLPRILRRPARTLSRIDIELPRRFGLKAALALLFAFFAYGIVAGGHLDRLLGTVTAAVGFKIDAVRITGQSETAELEVLNQLAIPDHASIVMFDVHEARLRVEEIPWVESATIRKIYPGTLEIEITEREPFALWQRNGDVALIDVEGRVLSAYVAPRYRGLPVLVGAGAQSEAEQILALIAEFPTLHERIRAATLVSGRRWDLTLKNDIVIMLPEEDPIPALVQLEALDQSQRILSRDILSVDLRLADRVVVALDDGVLADVAATVAAARGGDR